MKRYLTAYSRETLTIRDRKTGQTKRITHTDKDTAEVIQQAVKTTNYNLTNRTSKVEKKPIEEVQSWLNSVSKKHRTEWGWIQPDKIKWVKDEPKEVYTKETKKQELIQRLDNLLNGDY